MTAQPIECALCGLSIPSGQSIFYLKDSTKIVCERCVQKLVSDYQTAKGLTR